MSVYQNCYHCFLRHFFSRTGSVRRRMTVSMVLETIVIALTIVLASLNTESWTVAFFYITMITIVVLNMGAGVFQNLSYALAAQLPMRYTNGIMIGQNASGTAFAIALLVSISAAPDQQASAITYFCIALAFMVIMFFLFQSIFRNKYYLSVVGSGGSECGSDNSCEAFAMNDDASPTLTAMESVRKYCILLTQCWTQVLNAFLVYFVGLSIFPAIQVGVKSTDNILPGLYFTPVTCFLLFNVTALLGTILTSGSLPIPGPRFLWIPVTLRLLFIPFFLLCNYDPLGTRTAAVWFGRDWIYCLASSLQGLSLGYLGSLAVMYAPRIVEKEDSQTAGMMAGLACMLGMFTGVSTGFLWPAIIAWSPCVLSGRWTVVDGSCRWSKMMKRLARVLLLVSTWPPSQWNIHHTQIQSPSFPSPFWLPTSHMDHLLEALQTHIHSEDRDGMPKQTSAHPKIEKFQSIDSRSNLSAWLTRDLSLCSDAATVSIKIR